MINRNINQILKDFEASKFISLFTGINLECGDYKGAPTHQESTTLRRKRRSFTCRKAPHFIELPPFSTVHEEVLSPIIQSTSPALP